MQEVWRDVAGYEGYYQVSNMGKVRSVDRIIHVIDGKRKYDKLLRGVELKQIVDRKHTGYLHVSLVKDGVQKSQWIHRLVAIAFIPNPLGLPEVNHKDETRENNRADNLEWVTHEQNVRYGTRTARAMAHTDFYDKAKALRKPVIQYDMNMNKIREWESQSAVQRELGFSQTNISKACRGDYTQAYGYYWRFAD